MTGIKIAVTGTQIAAQAEGLLTSGMVGVPVTFCFDEAWDGLFKTAVFTAGGKSVDRVDIEAETTVPWEVLQKKNCTLRVGVFGVNEDGTLVMPTVWAEVGTILPGADPAGDASTDPSLPVWQQLLNENKQQAEQIRQLTTQKPKELTMSLSELAAQIKMGNFTGINVGDYIKLETGIRLPASPFGKADTVLATAYVMGIDTHYGIGNPGSKVDHHVDFVILGKEIAPYIKGKMNKTDTNNGTAEQKNPWLASDAYHAMNDADGEAHIRYFKFRSESSDRNGDNVQYLEDYIVEKSAQVGNRYSSAGAVSGSTGWDANTFTSLGKFWLPTEVEVFGRNIRGNGKSDENAGGGLNVQYPLFRGGLKPFAVDETEGFWLCTPKADNSTAFCVVKSNGNATAYTAAYTLCYPVCFRIG